MGKKILLLMQRADGETGKRRRVIQAGQLAYKSPSGETTPAPGKVCDKDAEAGGGSRVRHLKTPSKPPDTCGKMKLVLMPIEFGTPRLDQRLGTVPDWSNRHNRASEASFHNLPRISR